MDLSEIPKCTYIRDDGTKEGKQCGIYPVVNNGYCLIHDHVYTQNIKIRESQLETMKKMYADANLTFPPKQNTNKYTDESYCHIL